MTAPHSIDQAAPRPATTPAAPPSSLPLAELIFALDAHAAGLPRPLPTDHPIPLPATLPQRFDAPLDLITPGRYQPRVTFDQAELDELAASIAEHGVLTPLLVVANEAGRLELVAGERRLRAARQIGLAFVPIDVRSYTLRQIAEISGIDNIQRAGLSAAEEGAYFNRLISELSISENELSKRLGKNRAYIQQRRAIALAAPEVLQALAAEEITFSQARAIAQAAPGQAKAQQQALTKLRELAKQGKRTTETEARQVAEKIVLSKQKKALEGLGWIVSESYAYTVIWAPSERPRPWTGAEILEAIEAKRRPAGKRPSDGGAAGGEALQVLRLKYRTARECSPWFGLAPGYNQLPTYYAPAELPALAEPIAEAWAALVARYAAQGWQLNVVGGADYCTIEAKAAHAYRSMYTWEDAEQYIAQIEAGKVKDEKPKGAVVAAPRKCDGCKKPNATLEYVDDRQLCKACATKVKKEIAARKERIATEVRGVMEAWLLAAPPDALRLLGALLGSRSWDDKGRQERAAALRAADPATLAATVQQRVVELAVEYHASPVYDVAAQPAAQPAPPADFDAALLDLVGDPRLFVGQTRRALPLLDRQGLATVAGAIKAIARRLPDVPPVETPAPWQARQEQAAAPIGPIGPIDGLMQRMADALEDEFGIPVEVVAQPAPSGESLPGSKGADDAPLARIDAAVAAFEGRRGHAQSEAELRATLDHLAQLADELDWLADDETVDDAAFEGLSTRMSTLSRAIIEQIEGLPVATLESEVSA